MKSVFYMPTRVFEEDNCVKNHADLLGTFGKKALIVTGRSSAKKNNSYSDVCEALDSVGVGHVLFDEVEENPSIETVMKGREFGVSNGVDFCIGIGGGSPLDAAKAIALMIKHKDEDSSYMYDGSKPSDTIPVVAIPTTCGTGSEVTGVSVITIHEKKTKGSIKHLIFPDVALIDGKYLAYASKSLIFNTAIDAFAHLVESVINASATDYSRMCAHAGLKKWGENLEVLRALLSYEGGAGAASVAGENTGAVGGNAGAAGAGAVGGNAGVAGGNAGAVGGNAGVAGANSLDGFDWRVVAKELIGKDIFGGSANKDVINKIVFGGGDANIIARDYVLKSLMRASTFAGMAIAHTGTSIPHALSYNITYSMQVPHGKACGHNLAGYMACADANVRDYILDTAGFTSLDDYQNFFENACGDFKVPEDFALKSIDEFLQNEAKIKLVPFKVDREVLKKIEFFGG